MSGNAHGRSAINILAPRVTSLFHSTPRQYFCSRHSQSLERSRRNLSFCPFLRRDRVVLQPGDRLTFEGRLISWKSPNHLLKCASLGTVPNAPEVSARGNSKWPSAPAICMFRQAIRGGRRQHNELLIYAMRRQFKSSFSRAHEGESIKNVAAENEKAGPSVAALKTGLGANTTNKHIIDRLPNITHIHRPTKEELLAAATGFWSRVKVRFKWFSIRSARPFNIDEIGAFFSWILVGHVLWIILGTTTFFSLAIFAVNTVFAQGDITLFLLAILYLLLFRDASPLGRKLPN